MLNPKDIQKIIDRGDIVIQCLSKWGLTFKVPMIKCKIASLGYQYVWNGLSREDTTKELLEIGFDNLTLVQIMEAFVKLAHRLEQARAEAKARPPVSMGKRLKWEESIRARVRAGNF